MTRSAEEMPRRGFTLVAHGYDPDEVQAYLREVAADPGRSVDAAVATGGRWRDAGDAVARVLEAAQIEAAGLVEAAEAVAVEIRSNLRMEAAKVRADADQQAFAARAEAELLEKARRRDAEAALIDTEAELAAVVEQLLFTRLEAERLESDAIDRASAILKAAEVQARTIGADQLAQARVRLDRIRAAEAEAAARLGRLRDLVAKSLDTFAEEPADAHDDEELVIDLSDPRPPEDPPIATDPVPGSGHGSDPAAG
ncbi:hypothetical protein [Aquihabitans sp. McL0605]|uniref:hypothetical protein n=1 Tax=Aquihabitans sp. McL0605 TaxID=3415671 RepID=UPI003CF9548E